MTKPLKNDFKQYIWLKQALIFVTLIYIYAFSKKYTLNNNKKNLSNQKWGESGKEPAIQK